jgi:hypothetical protein
VRGELDRKRCQIEINGTNLTMGLNQASNEVKINDKTCGCRFRFDESMLMGIEFGLKWYEMFSCMIVQIFWKIC